MALVDPMQAVRNETAAEYGIEHQFDRLEQALEKVAFDAVVITTPTPTHMPLTQWRRSTASMYSLKSPWR